MPSDYARIETVIQYLEESFQAQPSLEDLSRHLNLSPFHFQKLFKRWAGISPKRFLQFLTVEYAKKLLNESRSVLEATHESGLSGPGRLHDLFVSIEAMTPGEFKSKAAGMDIFYGVHSTPFGNCLLAVTSKGICDLSFFSADKQLEAITELKTRWPEAKLCEKKKATGFFLDQIFPKNGKRKEKQVKLLLKGTNFQIKVWKALLEIPSGGVLSYEDIARYVGIPKASRAVGSAVAANPISYIIPCHRVIRKGGFFGNYHWNPARKKAMLGWEAARKYPES
jgi:AraC family transcriptional regulator of adaptative response/methylated-DNA-[protein]-cysteine methyltransferase